MGYVRQVGTWTCCRHHLLLIEFAVVLLSFEHHYILPFWDMFTLGMDHTGYISIYLYMSFSSFWDRSDVLVRRVANVGY